MTLSLERIYFTKSLLWKLFCFGSKVLLGSRWPKTWGFWFLELWNLLRKICVFTKQTSFEVSKFLWRFLKTLFQYSLSRRLPIILNSTQVHFFLSNLFLSLTPLYVFFIMRKKFKNFLFILCNFLHIMRIEIFPIFLLSFNGRNANGRRHRVTFRAIKNRRFRWKKGSTRAEGKIENISSVIERSK